MHVTKSYQGLKDKYRNIVVGLGNFDGVHIGHQRLITEVVSTAKNIGGTAVILTFDPHPLSVLAPNNNPPKLLTQQGKEKMIGRLGVDAIISVPFNLEFAKMTPEEFIEKVLYEQLAAKVVVVGYNYTFGNKGAGNADTLKSKAEKYKYQVKIIPPVKIGDQVISSTLIRRYLMEGDVTEATKYLGHPPFVEGIVVSGDRRGNTIGFPTANLNLDQEQLVPAKGVYSVHVVVDEDTFLGVANIGIKPTFNGAGGKTNLEVHLLDFSGDLYGKNITVKFIRRLRSEQRFSSVHELVSQIKNDIKEAQADRM
ncbi:bifunctional riboflavin kinase/FAD synthetase [Desulfofalx alkaliphila]|uniref:bifunctional riboflavin kinase/FAD synthetase n=1 Tax=Desulfofalx alkaliphila TaxID=105483 RepID=UPI0004E0CBB1|nr:bifunctional riboflavin kinase/FAD synthetase [Desulfofalx alkaliphila]